MRTGYCCKCGEYGNLGEHDELCDDCYAARRDLEYQEAAINPDAERCPHCGAPLPHFQTVIDSGEPYYREGVICPGCGRFVELDGQDDD